MGEKEVGSLLGISRHTVHSYAKRIYLAYAVNSRAQLLRVVAGDPTFRTDLLQNPGPPAIRQDDASHYRPLVEEAVVDDPTTPENALDEDAACEVRIVLPERIAERILAKGGDIEQYICRLVSLIAEDDPTKPLKKT